MFPLINEQLESGGSTSFAIHGTSMKPMMKDRVDSVRIVKPTNPPKKYDIIFYRRSDGQFVLHRIVGVKDGGFICRGDNQTVDEFPVPSESIIGIVTDYTKNGKWQKIDRFSQKCYSRFWVNTVGIRRIKRKIWVWGNKNLKGTTK